jgi:hypothetical protein
VLGDAGEHARPELIVVVECEDDVGPTLPFEDSM